MKLTERQRLILERLRLRNIERDGAETGNEMAASLWYTGAFTALEQGQRTCKQLVAKGLAVELGVGPYNARCYGPAGEEA